MQEALLPEAELLPRGGRLDKQQSDRGRVYYLDWMRVIAIYLVVFYHVVQGLDWVSFYDHIPGMKKFVVSFRASALQIGMPMFFHISGRAHALSPSTGLKKTFVRRAQRLLLPFAVCYVMLIPPWQYLDWEYDWQHPSAFHMNSNLIPWLLKYYTTAEFLIYFDFAWLWFLPALYVIIVFSAPLFLLAERYHAARNYRLYFCAAISLWSLLALGLVACGFTWQFTFFSVVGPASAVAIARFVPVPPHARTKAAMEERGEVVQLRSPMQMWLASQAYNFIQVASNIGLVLTFRYSDIDPPRADGGHDLRAAVPFMVMSVGFYVHGYFTHRWGEGSLAAEGDGALWWMWPYKILSLFTLLLLVLASSPGGEVESGHFIYPIYSASYEAGAGFGAVYVLGTWAYIAVFVFLFQAYCDNHGGAAFHTHATSSTIVVYIFHWVFVKVFAFWWLNPTLARHRWIVNSAWVALLITLLAFLTSTGLSLCIYALLVFRAPRVGRLFGL